MRLAQIGIISSNNFEFNLYSGWFNGAAYLSLPEDAALSFTDGSGNDSPFTISVWINPFDLFRFRILGRSQGTDNHTMMVGLGPTGASQFFLYGDGVGANNINATGPALVNQKWQHLVFTYDGSKANTGFEIYLDSVKQSLTRSQGSGDYDGMVDYGPMQIGMVNISDDLQHALGYIDEVAIFKGVAFTQSEVNEIYSNINALAHSQSANLSAYYRMENNADDSSGNALNATNNDVEFSEDVPYEITGNSDLHIQLSGQSNARGRSGGESLYSYLSAAMTKTDIYVAGSESWAALNIPENNLSADSTAGPEGGSAYEWEQLGPVDRKIYFAKFAVGATPLWDDPSRDNFNVNDDTYINDLVAHNQALADREGDTNPRRVLWWIHGESDGGDLVSTEDYKQYFTEMLAVIEAVEPFEFIGIAILNENADTPGTAAIRQALQEITESDNRYFAVEMNNYAMASDDVHYTMSSNVRIGADFLRETLKKLNLYKKK